ncbi:MMPL family transporter [Spirillospora sp. CA-294931]|uniref:MMPL family transporter n=1 Tax=Spirillospora sp. CA-294931 TaxID=3240042 RepID=UPI003D94E836
MIRTISGFAVRRPLVVLMLWTAVLVAGFGVGTGVFSRLVSDVGTVPGSESQRAEQRVDAAAPGPETVGAVITGSPSGVEPVLASVRTIPGVTKVEGPLRSASGTALLVRVELAPGDGQEHTAETVSKRLHGIANASVAVGGGPIEGRESDEQAQKDVARAEMLSMPVVVILLLLVFGGFVAAGLPLLIAVVGVGGTFGTLFAFSAFSDVSVYAIQITTMLAVGLGVDYALLIVSRFREERRTAPDVPSAVLAASATAGRTVLFSGLTVAVSLAGLVVFPDPFLRSMGFAAAAVVAIDMIAALTLLPAMLTLVGKRISPAKERGRDGAFARIARGVQRRPVLTLVAAAGVMVVLAAPVLGLRISEGDPRQLPDSTQTRQLWDGLAAHFPEQAGPGHVHVVAGTSPDDPALARLRGQIAAVPGITGTDVARLAPRLTLINATPAARPEEPAGRAAVAAIRDLRAPFEIGVTGDAAKLADYRAMLAERLPWAILLVAAGTLVLLFAFTGSVVLPVKAMLTNLLSIGAALGAVVWVFQQGHLAELLGAQGLDYVHLSVPVLVGAIAFGLSMDYEVFLLSRIRESWLAGADPRAAVADGLQRTGGIVTAAALVIAVVFAGFVAGGFTPIKAVGLGLVLAIVLDATIVRMLLVPATMTLLGRRNWWLPAPLRKAHDRIALAEAQAS